MRTMPIVLMCSSLVSAAACSERQRREDPVTRGSPMPSMPDDYELYKDDLAQAARSSDRERHEFASGYTLRAVKYLLQAREIEGRSRSGLDAQIKALVIAACGMQDTPAARQHIETTSLEELYPLERLGEISAVLCASVYLRDGSRLQGRKPVPGWI